MPDPKKILIDTATKFIGIKEDTDILVINEFRKAVTGRSYDQPWCMSFAQYCIAQTEKTLGIKSKIFRSDGVLIVWEKSPISIRLEKPEPGCLMLWNFAGTRMGHVGIVVDITPNFIVTVEGNTTGGPGIKRMGDGVYKKNRLPNGSDKMKVLGFLKPFS
ncbi:MAG: CHAP domain-containing protein [Proteobacteria bacterium]|nr:CHAP domain-containing protein [Pseudomonadota bacterium]NDD04487.1 CHAP domain-containing protein [Pseudomonadota bacterium]